MERRKQKFLGGPIERKHFLDQTKLSVRTTSLLPLNSQYIDNQLDDNLLDDNQLDDNQLDDNQIDDTQHNNNKYSET
jgi:hypothetical protein